MFPPFDLSRYTPSGKVFVHSSAMKRSASTGRICQFVGQETSTSTKVYPRPSAWNCSAFLIAFFAARTCFTSCVETRSMY